MESHLGGMLLSSQARASRVVVVVKNPLANAGDMGSIPGSGRTPGGGDGNQLQYSCLGNPMNRGAWRAIQFMGLQKLDTTEWLSMHASSKVGRGGSPSTLKRPSSRKRKGTRPPPDWSHLAKRQIGVQLGWPQLDPGLRKGPEQRALVMSPSPVAPLALHGHPPLCLATLSSSSISLGLRYSITLLGIIISITDIVDFGLNEALKSFLASTLTFCDLTCLLWTHQSTGI